MNADPVEVQKSVRSYITVFVALMICTIVTVAASRFHFAIPIAIGVALAIAIVKGSMVAGVFMHLSHEKQLIYGTVALAILFFLALLLLPVLTHLDQAGVMR
jgi:caa(3)-type oxidase subunit IV